MSLCSIKLTSHLFHPFIIATKTIWTQKLGELSGPITSLSKQMRSMSTSICDYIRPILLESGFSIFPRMAYIEENLKIRSRPRDDSEGKDKGPVDPQEALYQLADRWKVDKQKPTDDGSVTNSISMLTAIPEVDLGMECVVIHVRFIAFSHCAPWSNSTRLKNIEETEKAKRVVAEERHDRDRKKVNNDEEHLVASRCKFSKKKYPHECLFVSGQVYRPNHKTKSDADILRDAKLEAMGLPPQDDQPRRNYDNPQMATDEMVRALLSCRCSTISTSVLRSWNDSKSG